MFDTSDDTDIELELPPMSEVTREELTRFVPIYVKAYEGYKRDFMLWLHRKGKNPFKGEGYAQEMIDLEP